eukprot:3940664-Rhodomonas_salina.1
MVLPGASTNRAPRQGISLRYHPMCPILCSYHTHTHTRLSTEIGYGSTLCFSTEIGYAATTDGCIVLSCTVVAGESALRMILWYRAMLYVGTEVGYGAMPYCGTEIGCGATAYGTEIGYGAMLYCGTEIGYGATGMAARKSSCWHRSQQ